MKACIQRSHPAFFQYTDADNVLTNDETLQLLMVKNKTLVAPMLNSQTGFSNFWCGITPQVCDQ